MLCHEPIVFFSLFIYDLALPIESTCSPAAHLHPDIIQLFLLFANHIVLIADTVFGLQKRIVINIMSVNLDKTKIVVFKKGGILSETDKWYYKGQRLDCVPAFK